MVDAPLALGFTAGMVAAFNPCGFAMLPAYMSWFLGQEGRPGEAGSVGVLRSLAVGSSVSLGFLAVFGVAGVVASHLFSSFTQYTPYATIVIGLGVLVPLGLARFFGREVKLNLPRFQRAAHDRGLVSMVLFGVSYATVSLSCTLLPFLVAVSGTFQQENLASGLAVFFAYSAGMGVVLMALTLALGLARASLLSHFRRALRHVGRLSGALLVVAGAYITYYGWYSLAVNDGRDVAAGPVAAVERASDRVVRLFADVGEVALGLILAAFIAFAVLVGLSRRRRRHHPGSWSTRGPRMVRTAVGPEVSCGPPRHHQ